MTGHFRGGGDTGIPEFVPFPKIGRLNRNAIITEKIDGTNAQVTIYRDAADELQIIAGSRKRWITPDDDNFGFAAWVAEHQGALIAGLGEGTHFGEWWGSGIQRGYGLKDGEKRFSLFNTGRWGGADTTRPSCCDVVPVLGYAGKVTDLALTVDTVLNDLRVNGSVAAPNFPDAEGVVIFFPALGLLTKVTIKGDDKPKSSVEPEQEMAA